MDYILMWGYRIQFRRDWVGIGEELGLDKGGVMANI